MPMKHEYVDGGILIKVDKPPEPAGPQVSPLPAASGGISVPEVKVSGDAARAAAREVIKLWKIVDPDEYRAYAKECEDIRKTRARANGMSNGGELAMPYVLPAYVALMMGRFFQDYNWYRHDEAAVQAVLSELPCSRIGMDWKSSALCDADKR